MHTPVSAAPVIDFHVHMLNAEVFEASTNRTVFTGFGATPAKAPRPGAQSLIKRMFDPAKVLADMDQRRVDVAVISSSTVLQGSAWADADTDLALCQRCNEQAADWVAQHPQRFVGSMVLPMQSPERAVVELVRAHDQLGLRVLNLSSSYQGVYLGDPVFAPFWDVVADRGLVAWVHPEGVSDPWFQRYALWNSLGQSIEETKCMASLMYEGVMTRHPQLQVVMAHGGGYFPHYMGRLDRNTLNRPDTVRHMDGLTPSAMLRRFHYDACVYDPQVLQVLMARVGADRLVLGSDYPVGEKDPLAWLQEAGVQGANLQAIAGGNAARLLGLMDT